MANWKREELGLVRLYHATSSESGALIYTEGWMKAGQSGMFGGAIYFADSEDSARYKAHHGADVMITALVNMGWALVLQSPANTMTLATVRSHGCDTIRGRSNTQARWEYVVFEASRITLLSVDGKLPFLRLSSALTTAPLVCTYSQHGAQYIGQPWYHCRTCGLIGGLGCCRACFELCHRGHDGFFDSFSRSCYCDCGAGHQSHFCKSDGPICTYAKHGAQYVKQPWYHCRTCGLVDDVGFCLGCYQRCHKGHDTYTVTAEAKDYCHCGAGDKCQLTSKTSVGKHVCTYRQHGSQYIGQPWYHCRTCSLVGSLGCCKACFELCHRGHDAFFENSSPSCYCDCGANPNCKCMKL
jgi:hypothetical protein